MTKSGFSNVRVGLVVLLGLAILGAAILSIGSGTRWFVRTELLRTYFQRTNGLQVGAQVTLEGVTIGAVDGIDFPADVRSRYVVVRIWVEALAARRIAVDSVATIKTMGLLGDKYIEIMPGNSTQLVEAGGLLKSEDPIDYEVLLGKKDTGDFFANLMQASQAARDILTAVNSGQGLLGELLHGSRENQPSMRDLKQTVSNLAAAGAQLNAVLARINQGRGVAGALLSDNARSRRLLQNLDRSLAALRVSAERIQQLSAAVGNGNGLLPQLLSDRAYADQIMQSLRQSTSDLQQILDKINSGQGTLGKLVNDPSLYNQADSMLGGVGWKTVIMRGLYSLAHPFGNAPSQAESASSAGAQPVQQPADISPAH